MDEFKRMHYSLKPSQKKQILILEENYTIPVIPKRKRDQNPNISEKKDDKI